MFLFLICWNCYGFLDLLLCFFIKGFFLFGIGDVGNFGGVLFCSNILLMYCVVVLLYSLLRLFF